MNLKKFLPCIWFCGHLIRPSPCPGIKGVEFGDGYTAAWQQCCPASKLSHLRHTSPPLSSPPRTSERGINPRTSVFHPSLTTSTGNITLPTFASPSASGPPWEAVSMVIQPLRERLSSSQSFFVSKCGDWTTGRHSQVSLEVGVIDLHSSGSTGSHPSSVESLTPLSTSLFRGLLVPSRPFPGNLHLYQCAWVCTSKNTDFGRTNPLWTRAPVAAICPPDGATTLSTTVN